MQLVLPIHTARQEPARARAVHPTVSPPQELLHARAMLATVKVALALLSLALVRFIKAVAGYRARSLNQQCAGQAVKIGTSSQNALLDTLALPEARARVNYLMLPCIGLLLIRRGELRLTDGRM